MRTIQTSRKLRFCALTLIAGLVFTSCSKDEVTVKPTLEEELITTLIATYVPVGGGNEVVLKFKDLDGEGGNAPEYSVSNSFITNTTYNGTLKFLNEAGKETINTTEEILELAKEHQIFYQTTGTLNAFTYGTSKSNFDVNNNPIGIESVFKTTGTALGSLTITLRHQPNKSASKVAQGDITNAGGSVDLEVTFPTISVINIAK